MNPPSDSRRAIALRWLRIVGCMVFYGGIAVFISGSFGYSCEYQDGVEAQAPWYVIPSCRARTDSLAIQGFSKARNESMRPDDA